ncbi:MAG: TOBE domain-containing protein, partial [Oscillospiraceae bacterium]
GTTFIYVTHDQVEAMTMGTRIVVMKDGFIQQVDSPQNLYEKPINIFVAGFMGSPQMNFIDVVMAEENGKLLVKFGNEVANGEDAPTKAENYTIELPDGKRTPELESYIGKDLVLGIRPENLKDEEMFLSAATTGLIECTVDVTEMMGAETFLYVTCAGMSLTARVSPRSTTKPGDTIKMAIDVNKIHLFDKETEKVILN